MLDAGAQADVPVVGGKQISSVDDAATDFVSDPQPSVPDNS